MASQSSGERPARPTTPPMPPLPPVAPQPAPLGNQVSAAVPPQIPGKPSGGRPRARVRSGPIREGERIGIYGPGGIGKTELAASLKVVGINPFFIDLDKGSYGLHVDRAMLDDGTESGRPPETFGDVRAVLDDLETIRQFDAVVVDTLTRCEELMASHVIRTVPHENAAKGKEIRSIEDYGYGKGYQHVFDAGLLLLQDLDRVAAAGKHVIIICHQVTERVPSATSEDFLEYQPRLQSPPKIGKYRERVFEWCNHFFRLDRDRSVTDAHALNVDVRTIYTTGTATFWAKHRSLDGRIIPDVISPYLKGDAKLWACVFGSRP